MKTDLLTIQSNSEPPIVFRDPGMKVEGKEKIMDPSGRFEKNRDLVSAERRLALYVGYDQESGNVVTGGEFQLPRLPEAAVKSIMERMALIKSVSSPLFTRLLTFWMNPKCSFLFYISEAMGGGSLASLVMSAEVHFTVHAISRWFKSVMEALVVLEDHNPPIPHGRIRLDTVFIKGSSGSVKILMPLPYSTDRKGFPLRYWTAPEALNGIFDAKSDLWMVGILLLYCLTTTQPYLECKCAADLVMKLKDNVVPDLLESVTDEDAKDLVRLCLAPHSERKRASELVNHRFFAVQAQVDHQPLIKIL
jgi:WNK lysine deficient protein kinase